MHNTSFVDFPLYLNTSSDNIGICCVELIRVMLSWWGWRAVSSFCERASLLEFTWIVSSLCDGLMGMCCVYLSWFVFVWVALCCVEFLCRVEGDVEEQSCHREKVSNLKSTAEVETLANFLIFLRPIIYQLYFLLILFAINSICYWFYLLLILLDSKVPLLTLLDNWLYLIIYLLLTRLDLLLTLFNVNLFYLVIWSLINIISWFVLSFEKKRWNNNKTQPYILFDYDYYSICY